jgi:hypothetical protein
LLTPIPALAPKAATSPPSLDMDIARDPSSAARVHDRVPVTVVVSGWLGAGGAIAARISASSERVEPIDGLDPSGIGYLDVDRGRLKVGVPQKRLGGA